MSIADKLTQLTSIRADCRTALTNKGVSASDHDFADFAADIGSIPSGGGENTIKYSIFDKTSYEVIDNDGNI